MSWIGLLLLWMSLSLQPATAAPEYALSGYSAELEKTVLAKTPQGTITALDLLMFTEMTDQSLWRVPIDALLDAKSLEAEPFRDIIHDAVERMAAAQALAARAGDWRPAEDQLRVMSYGAGEAAWIEQTIQPEVKVEPADIDRYYLEHANDYLRRRQAQVRYIFKRVDPLNEEEVSTLRHSLESMAQKAREGSINFADVAREESESRSAAEGGLLPPFYDGTYFSMFEQMAFSMDKPGQISPAFEGPGGLYILQLVRFYPMRNITIQEVSGDIAKQLAHDHVRHYFKAAIAQLQEDQYSRNFSSWWMYLNPEAPVAYAGQAKLGRQDLIRFYGNPTDLQYQVRWDVVGNGIKDWIEGELVMQQIEAAGQGRHRWVEQARAVAAMVLRSRHTLAVEAPEAAFASPQAALKTLQTGDPSIRPIQSVHLVQFQITPELKKLTPTESRQALRQVKYLEDQLRLGTLRTEPAPTEIESWREEALKGGPQHITAAIKELNVTAGNSPWVNVKMSIKEQGWATPLPDEPFYRLLQNVKPGQFSQTQEIGPAHALYLVMETAPAKLDPWLKQPMALRALAFLNEARRIEAREREQLRSQKAIEFQM